MKKITTLLIAIILFSCKDNPKQEAGTVEDIKSYERIETYFFNGSKNLWEKSEPYTFEIPKDGSKLLSLYGGFGIDKGQNIEYYSLTMNDNGWERSPSYDFKKNDSDEIVPVFGGLGIKRGNTIEYYTMLQNDKGWERNKAYDIKLPSSSTEYITMFAGYGIKNGDKIDYYVMQQKDKGWKRSPKFDLTIQKGKDFISFHEHIFFGGLGIFDDNEIEFYSLGQDGWKRTSEMDFDTTNFNQDEIISVSGGIGIMK